MGCPAPLTSAYSPSMLEIFLNPRSEETDQYGAWAPIQSNHRLGVISGATGLAQVRGWHSCLASKVREYGIKPLLGPTYSCEFSVTKWRTFFLLRHCVAALAALRCD